MANDLVVQLGAKLDRFQSDMNQAGDIADAGVSRIERSFENLNPNIGSGFLSRFGGVIGGVVAAGAALLAFLRSVNEELANIAKNAEFVGVSVEKFQSLKFAATQTGVGGDQAVTDLRRVASLLADARDNENSLTRLLDANNVKYRDRNGEIVKTDEFLKIAAATINRFDSFPEKVKAAEMLGLSEAWVRALRENGKQFQEIAEKAEEAGAVIDRSTIAKAERFDREWKKSADNLATQFKVILGDIAGEFNDLIDKASEFITEFNKARGTAAGTGEQKFSSIADSLVILIRDLFDAGQSVEQLDRELDRLRKNPNVDQAIVAGLEEIRAKAVEAADAAKSLSQKLDDAFGSFKQFEKVPLPSARPESADRPDPNRFRLPSRAGGAAEADAFTQESERIARHTAQINADSIAVFQNKAAQAGLRAEFQLLNAIRKDEGEVTDEQITKYTEFRATLTADEALRRSGIALTDEHKAAFDRLTVGITNSTTALDRAHLSLERINSASSQLGSALSTAFADAVVEGKNLNDVFSSLLKTLEKAAINSLFANIFNPTSLGGPSLFASLLPRFASGTDYAPGGWAWVGESGPELVNLNRGAQVIPNAVATGGGGMPIVFSPHIDARGADVAAVARIAQVMTQQQKSFASDVVAVIKKAKQGRTL